MKQKDEVGFNDQGRKKAGKKLAKIGAQKEKEVKREERRGKSTGWDCDRMFGKPKCHDLFVTTHKA